jgi:hypothetical protein
LQHRQTYRGRTNRQFNTAHRVEPFRTSTAFRRAVWLERFELLSPTGLRFERLARASSGTTSGYAAGKITYFVAVRAAFDATVCDFQPIDFIGLSPPQTLWNRTCMQARRQIRTKRRWRMPPMDSTFDIFKVTSDGPLWVEAVTGLEKAKERMAHLALTSPEEYFIHSQDNGVVAKQTQEYLEEIT